MIPLKQIFKLAVSERTTVRAPAGTSLKKRRRRRRQADFSKKRKRKNRHAARRISVQSGRHAAPTASSKSRGAVSLRSTLALAGIFLLLVANALNRNDEWPRRADETQEQLPSPQIGLQENPASDSFEDVSPVTPRKWADFATPSEWIEIDLDSSAKDKPQRPTLWAEHRTTVITPVQRREAFADSSLRLTPIPAPFTELALRGAPRNEPPADLIAEAQLSEKEPQIGLRWKRLALIQTGSLSLAFMGIRKFDQYFGGAAEPFRLRNDWSRDRTLHFDELVHFQGSYRVAQGLIGLYRWSGLSETWSECLGAGTAASVMTLLEYIDGRRPKPKQGASFSDFTANLLGVGFALAKIHVGALEDIDFRLNYASFGDVLQKRTLLKYDRMTHWLTYNMKRQLHVPLDIGVGYGVQNAFKRNVRPEYYLGVGFTPVAILERYYPNAAKPLAWLKIYHVGGQVQIK
ncbi:DUF2279 domain-containing protein [candidate division KSB1 bacterium]|nr:DUF2279 domain-containing protein [candidate division KSB1 bacterium]